MNNQKIPNTYPFDTTEVEWELIVPHLPQPCPTGRPMEWDWRTLIDGIFYVLTTRTQ